MPPHQNERSLKKEAETFFGATCIVLLPLFCTIRFQYKNIQRMIMDVKVVYAASSSTASNDENSYGENNNNDKGEEVVIFDSIETISS